MLPFNSFTFHYIGGDGGRSFDVLMICYPDADNTELAADSETPEGATLFHLKLILRYACSH